MKFNELFKKVKVANEINRLAKMSDVVVELNYENYKYYKFFDYKQFIKVINDEFIPELVNGLKEVEFELNKDFVITYQDFTGKTYETKFKVELF